MKTTILALILTASTAMAEGKTILGCEVVDMGGYFNKADPTCVFSNEDTRGSRLIFSDADGDPTTPDTLGSVDN